MSDTQARPSPANDPFGPAPSGVDIAKTPSQSIDGGSGQDQVNTSRKSPAPDRAADIRRSVALAEKRAAKEKALRENRMQRKQEEFLRSEIAVRAGAEEKEEIRLQRKAFRTDRRKREDDLEKEKHRREEEEKNVQERETIAKKKRDQQDLSMKELRQMATAKSIIEQKQNALRSDFLTEQKQAEYEHRTAIEQARRKNAQSREEIDRHAHDRKNAIDSELKTKLFELEKWRRMRLQAQDNDTTRQMSALRTMRDLREAERKREEIRLMAARLQRKLDGEWKERKTATEQEAMRKRSEVEQESKEAKLTADTELRIATQTADNAQSHRLEELTQQYNKQKRILRVST